MPPRVLLALTVAASRVGSQRTGSHVRLPSHDEDPCDVEGVCYVDMGGVSCLQHAKLVSAGWEIYSMVCNGGYSCICSYRRAPYAGFLGACWWSALCKFGGLRRRLQATVFGGQVVACAVAVMVMELFRRHRAFAVVGSRGHRPLCRYNAARVAALWWLKWSRGTAAFICESRHALSGAFAWS